MAYIMVKHAVLLFVVGTVLWLHCRLYSVPILRRLSTTPDDQIPHKTVKEPEVVSKHSHQGTFYTHVFPDDAVPVEIMVEHQRRGVSSAQSTPTVIMHNHPPWLIDKPGEKHGEIHKEGLSYLRGLENVQVVEVDYSQIDNPAYVNWLFAFDDTIRADARSAGHFSRLFHDHRQQSNFVAMMVMLKHCLYSPESGLSVSQICVMLDHDIFVYRRQLGILDLAADFFKMNQDAVVLIPPWGCQHNRLNSRGECKKQSAWRTSSRYMVVHRERLKAVLPLNLTLKMWHRPYFESVFTDAVEAQQKSTRKQWPGFFAQMDCGSETFVVHPAGKFSPKGTMWFSQVLELLAKILDKPAGEDCHRLATREFLRRMEAGKFIANHTTIKTVVGSCEDIVPDEQRILDGLAW